MSRRVGALAALIAAAGVLVTGCTADDEPSTAPPATFTSVPAPASTGGPSNPPASTAADTQADVKRGTATGVPGIDVLVTIGWADGKITPPAGTVDVQVGDKVRVHVSSDQRVDVNVEGHPEADLTVEQGDAGDLDWIVTQKGDSAVTLGADKTLLTTVQAV
ncbi:hypothetical protein VSH64_42890 [Amycolatopsis rhabdoformis]|uniref:DUF5666 domain-containing protein n=1 Tax=Amycolatopsis rhabdoformis TaxID=1448059 RepID=A0ABZ1I5C7_9PSEU|nr:hypothetical protein [Amycolatopsis rhabdoformis]WSE29480.1 hypothetical protein VSH64_42890 [Amycolatopsis rhabdoformis]